MLNKDFFLNSHTQKNVVNQGQKYKISLFRKYNLLYWRKILLGLFIFSLFSNFYFPILTFNSLVFLNAYQGFILETVTHKKMWSTMVRKIKFNLNVENIIHYTARKSGALKNEYTM